MKLTRLSLFYLIGYLVPSGVLLLLAPKIAFTLLLSNGTYDDIIPRLAGTIALALGLLVIQIVRLQIEVLYTTLAGIRAILMVCILSLYFYSHDPFFIVLFAIVALGVILTLTGYWLDHRAGRTAKSMTKTATAQ